MIINHGNNINRRRYGHDDTLDIAIGSEPQMVLLDKFKVESWCFESVVSQLESTLPILLRETDYTWQDLLGEDFWVDMCGLPSHLPSICLQHFAQQPDSPLTASPYYGVGVTTFQLR